MPRKKKEQVENIATVEVLEPPKQFEIDWDKIASDVKEAALMVKTNYPRDDGPLSEDQIAQIKKSAPKPKTKKTKKTKE